MNDSASSSQSSDGRDILHIAPAELRDTIRVSIDRELIALLDEQRGHCVSRSEYLEMVLAVALRRPDPHLPEGWTPERAAGERFARLVRYRDTGR
jgi:hypothetical protein